jgi:quinone-modifying oxidoreductase subunit QmoC
MSTTPDLQFTNDVIRAGGSDVMKCYQCATCSAICELAPMDKPFPRKEMIWAQWGLRERLMGDPDVWLCHQCNDCTVHCPRGAKPADVMSALRQLTVEHYAVPQALGRMVANPGMWPLLLAIPAVVIALILAALYAGGVIELGGHEVEYARMFPHAWLNGIFTLFLFIAGGLLITGLRRFWTDMDRLSPAGSGEKKPLIGSLIIVTLDFAGHNRFGKCTDDRYRKLSHLGVVAGFAGLLLVTAVAIVYILAHLPYPMPQSNPFKILGNLSALAMFVGLLVLIFKRFEKRQTARGSSYFDWSFLALLMLVVATGVLTEVARLAGVAAVAYPVYYVHLIIIWSLFVYAPYSKMAHLAYRLTALVHARVNGREEV